MLVLVKSPTFLDEQSTVRFVSSRPRGTQAAKMVVDPVGDPRPVVAPPHVVFALRTREAVYQWHDPCGLVPPGRRRARRGLTEDMKKEYCGYENVQHILDTDDFIYKPSYKRYRELTYYASRV